MEAQQPQQQQSQQPQNEDNNGGGAKGSFLCRQSSTRWTPTTDQIRILKDLYYNNGVRSPSSEQIQRISARLRQYGKIEGKNVFYWFQNHKARERQKKRFINDNVNPMQQHRNVNSNAVNWKPEDYTIQNNNKYSNHSTSPGFSTATPSSSSGFNVGQMGNLHGSVTMEKSFRECSISAGANSSIGGSISYSYGSVGNDAYNSSYMLFDKRKSINTINIEEDEQDEIMDEEEETAAATEIETLPLFPVHREDHINPFCNIKQNHPNYYYRSSWNNGSDDGNGTSRTSLELSLNSYTGQTHDFI